MTKKSDAKKTATLVTKGSTIPMVASKLTNDNNEKYNNQVELLILNKYIVDEAFYDTVLNKYLEIRPALMIEKEFSPMELVGETFWVNLTDWGKRAAILCLKNYALLNSSSLKDITIEGSEASRFEFF